MEWIKIDINNTKTIPNVKQQYFVCYIDVKGVKRYTTSQFVSNNFIFYYEDVWWCEIIEPK